MHTDIGPCIVNTLIKRDVDKHGFGHITSEGNTAQYSTLAVAAVAMLPSEPAATTATLTLEESPESIADVRDALTPAAAASPQRSAACEGAIRCGCVGASSEQRDRHRCLHCFPR